MGPYFFGLRLPWTLVSPLLCKWPSYLDIAMGKGNSHTWSMKEILRCDYRFQKEAWLHPRDKCPRKWLINILFSLAKPSEQRMCLQPVSGLVESTLGTSLTSIPCRRSLLHSSLSHCDIFCCWTRGNIQISKTPAQVLSISVPESPKYPSTPKMPNLDTFGTRNLQRAYCRWPEGTFRFAEPLQSREMWKLGEGVAPRP